MNNCRALKTIIYGSNVLLRTIYTLLIFLLHFTEYIQKVSLMATIQSFYMKM